MNNLKSDQRFQKIKPFEKKIWLSSPTMHGEELEYIKEAYDSNWVSTVGKNIDEVEKLLADYVGVRHAVALSCGTAALHLAIKLAADAFMECLVLVLGHCRDISILSDLTFDATVNPML